MKLLFIDFTLPYLLRDSEYPVGGWAVQLMGWLNGLNAAGHRCGVLTWKGANAHVGTQTLCELLETYDPNAGIKVLKYFYLRVPAMLSAARGWRPDVIVQSTRSVETGITAFIANRLCIPFVYRVASDADADDRYRTDVPLYGRYAYRFGLRSADLIICQNTYQAAGMKSARLPARLHVQPNIFRMPQNASRPRPRDGRGYVAWLGVFRKAKNLPLLLATAKRLPSVDFRVAGMPAAAIDPETARSLEDLRTLPNVRLVGYLKRADVPDFLAAATALLCTSHYEGFSNTFLEALATGTPIVTRKGVDPDSLIADQRLGRVAADDDDLADCIGEVHAMAPDDYDILARRCRHHVEAHHTPAPIMQSFIDALSPLVPNGASGR